MKKYLYLFNYPPEDQDLCQLEFKYLFHNIFQQYYLSNKDIDVNTSVFMKGKIDIWAMDEDFEKILEKIKDLNLTYLDFKVIYLKNTLTHVHYQESLKKCQDVSW